MDTYEKKYREAVAELSRIANDPNGDGVTLEKLERIFPELSESDDEKIRKEIIHYFTEGREFLSLCSVGREEILAYLENQGEQKPVEWSEGDNLRYCIDYVNPFHPTLDNGELNVRHYRIPSLVGDKGAESILTVILSFGAKIIALYRGNVRDGKLEDWETPMIVDKEDWFTEKWLKSLRPQKQWKPSEEQIKALKLSISFVTDDFDEHQNLSETLNKLLEQLKKLQNG